MAFEQVGGVEYLVRLAQEDPKTFVPLLIRTMPPEPNVPQEGGLPKLSKLPPQSDRCLRINPRFPP